MSSLRWTTRPELRDPILIAAFEGWTDAGDAASSAAAYLAGRWSAKTFADIDAEDYYDFTALRPQVRLRGELTREIIWPVNRFLAASMGGAHDVIILSGIEPHLRWRTFCECVTTVATEMGVRAAFTLGAMLADVAHTRPTPVRGSSADARLVERFGLERPRYQGPTGIVGVLQDAFAKVSIPVGSLMAQVPHYVSPTPSPKATLAIVERVSRLVEAQIPTRDLQSEATTYERRVNEAVAADDAMAAYVRELERRSDDAPHDEFADLPSGDVLGAQFEQFLREQDDRDPDDPDEGDGGAGDSERP
jgi:predicted ATP-grasp superfamily ATP-dependent carboligase